MLPGISKFMDDSKFGLGSLKGRTDRSRSSFSDFLNQMVSRSKEAQDQPRMTARDLFGEQMTRLTDSARSSANAAKQALSRAMLSGGGDVTGAAAGNMLGIQQNTNENISDIGLQFSKMADKVNRFRQQRGDQLAGQALQGLQNLLQFDSSMYSNRLNRQVQKETAAKQRKANRTSGILSGLGSIASAGIMAACWVAEELYGKDDPRVHRVRAFLMENEGEDNIIGEFYEKYKKHGRQWAVDVASDESARMAAERLFNELDELAKAA